jgi:hypothetical protein
VLELDYADDHLFGPLTPTDDDQLLVNDVTATRREGSSAQVVKESGPLSVQAPPNGVGLYDAEVTVNAYEDGQLQNIAGWLVHLGTWDESRYPSVSVNLAGAGFDAALIADATAVDIGDMISIDNPPSWLPPDLIELLVQGCTERITEFEWVLTWNTSPYGPYRTILLDDATYGRLAGEGHILTANITSGATSFQVTTGSGLPLWTTAAGDFPLDIIIGGEQMTVSSITGATSPQTFNISARSVNGVVKAHSLGDEVKVYRPTVLALT